MDYSFLVIAVSVFYFVKDRSRVSGLERGKWVFAAVLLCDPMLRNPTLRNPLAGNNPVVRNPKVRITSSVPLSPYGGA